MKNFDTWKGRQIIGRDTEILGGVYFARTAIVVDNQEQPDVYEQMYEEALARAQNDSPLGVANAVNSAVRSIMPHNPETTRMVLKTTAIQRGLAKLGLRHEIGLSEFIEGGGGVCYHQTLAVGATLRLFQQREGLAGNVSMIAVSPKPEAHTKIAFSGPGFHILADPAENYVNNVLSLPDPHQPLSGKLV